MTRIDDCFQSLKKRDGKAFIAYITAGHPTWEKTAELIPALEQAGVDIVELGIPFSDPMADGPIIQKSSEVALQNGTTLRKALEGLATLRAQCQIPILVFSYYNPVHRMGVEDFANAAKAAGADGALITDLTPESASEYKAIMDRNSLNTVFLAAPTTPEDRFRKIAGLCSGFVYYISRTGVTGVRESLETELAAQVERAKTFTSLPIAVGFGVSKPEHVASVTEQADGVVVGSAIVRKMQETDGNVSAVAEYVATLTAAKGG